VGAQEVPRRAPRRRPFLNAAGDGTQWDPRREEHSPLFVPQGFLVPVSQNPSWEAFSLVSGCDGGCRDSTGSPRFPLSRPSGYPVPSPESSAAVQVSPLFFPRQAPRSPTREGSGPQYPPFAAPPPRRGHNGKLSVMNFVKMAGTRLVPPHSLAFRPEWYPRAAHPTPRPLSLQRQNAAPRGCPPSGALQHAVSCETAPGGLPHQTHTLREVPRCANSFLLGAYRYKNRRPRPPTMWDGHVSVILSSQSGLARELTTHIPPGLAAPA
jgi:hypothetical protein